MHFEDIFVHTRDSMVMNDDLQLHAHPEIHPKIHSDRLNRGILYK